MSKYSKRDWEDMAKEDPFYAILSNDQKKYGKWDINEFFLTGAREIDNTMQIAQTLDRPLNRKVVLDFGCGVGRLTRIFSKYFENCYGVDISQTMILKAKELNNSLSNCKFIVNGEENLRIFEDNFFDMIYTNIVLQHISDKSIIKIFISEFIRVLKPNGLLVFQLPSYIPLRKRLQPRRRLYVLLRALGIHEKYLYKKLNLHPMKMNYIPTKKVLCYLESLGSSVLAVKNDINAGPSIESKTYYITKSHLNVKNRS